jgi:hypothetical protein
MFLDGIDIGLGRVIITDSKWVFNNKEIPIKCIDIYNKDHTYRFTFWTKQEYEKFNDLELNKKMSILDFIDDYDIDFGTKEYGTINSRENAEVYFTRIDNNKYIINAEIIDFEKCVLGKLKNHKNLKLEAIIDFNKQ